MKIGIFTDSYHPLINGVITSIDHVVKELRSRGNTVYIFAPRIRGYEDSDPYIIRIPSFRMMYSSSEVRFPIPIPHKSLQQIYRIDLDIIHAHGSGAFSFLGHQVARMKGMPYVQTFHTLYTAYTHHILRGKVIRPRMVVSGFKTFGNISDGLITPSQKMKDALITYGVKRPIIVIPNFINYKTFNGKKTKYLHGEFDIPKESPILLTVGRLGKEKNFPFVIKVFAKLLKKDTAYFAKHQFPYLVIVGSGMDEDMLRKLVTDLGIAAYVRFTGRVDVSLMPQVYKSATLFVFASTTETQGMCLLEAAASGLPLVVAKDEAFFNIINDKKDGYALPLKQKQFVEKISYLLKHPAIAEHFGAVAKETVVKNFQADVLIDSLLSFYTDMISSYNPKAKVLRKINRATLIPLFRATATVNRFLSS